MVTREQRIAPRPLDGEAMRGTTRIGEARLRHHLAKNLGSDLAGAFGGLAPMHEPCGRGVLSGRFRIARNRTPLGVFALQIHGLARFATPEGHECDFTIESASPIEPKMDLVARVTAFNLLRLPLGAWG
jgi:hypothetical protein